MKYIWWGCNIFGWWIYQEWNMLTPMTNVSHTLFVLHLNPRTFHYVLCYLLPLWLGSCFCITSLTLIQVLFSSLVQVFSTFSDIYTQLMGRDITVSFIYIFSCIILLLLLIWVPFFHNMPNGLCICCTVSPNVYFYSTMCSFI